MKSSEGDVEIRRTWLENKATQEMRGRVEEKTRKGGGGGEIRQKRIERRKGKREEWEEEKRIRKERG
jgi:hypothetical protein